MSGTAPSSSSWKKQRHLRLSVHHPRNKPDRVGPVGWGAGAAFEASVLSIAAITQDISDIAYFGDIGTKGLQVPANADRLATTYGLPRIRPAATGLYTALQQTGTPRLGQPALRAESSIRQGGVGVSG